MELDVTGAESESESVSVTAATATLMAGSYTVGFCLRNGDTTNLSLGGFNVVNSNGEFKFYTPTGAHIPAAAPWHSSGDRMDYHAAVAILCQKDDYLRNYCDNMPPLSLNRAEKHPSAEGRTTDSAWPDD